MAIVTLSTPWWSEDEWSEYLETYKSIDHEEFLALFQGVWPPQEACEACGGYGQVLDADDGQVECHRCRGTGAAKGHNKHG